MHVCSISCSCRAVTAPHMCAPRQHLLWDQHLPWDSQPLQPSHSWRRPGGAAARFPAGAPQRTCFWPTKPWHWGLQEESSWHPTGWEANLRQPNARAFAMWAFVFAMWDSEKECANDAIWRFKVKMYIWILRKYDSYGIYKLTRSVFNESNWRDILK